MTYTASRLDTSWCHAPVLILCCKQRSISSRYTLRGASRVGQSHTNAPYMTIYLVDSLPKKAYIHQICMVLANPRCKPYFQLILETIIFCESCHFNLPGRNLPFPHVHASMDWNGHVLDVWCVRGDLVLLQALPQQRICILLALKAICCCSISISLDLGSCSCCLRCKKVNVCVCAWWEVHESWRCSIHFVCSLLTLRAQLQTCWSVHS